MTLSARDLETLDALCRCIVPAAFNEEPHVDVVSAVIDRLSTLPARQRDDIVTALRIFDHRIAAIVFSASPRRFRDLSPDGRRARFAAWGNSAIGTRRTIYQALRRLVLSAYYAIPETHAPIGYAGPFRDRDPVVPWEGPMTLIGGDAQPSATPAPRLPSTDSIPAGMTLRCDVCVIGSGAGGSVAAARLAESGLSVIVVEEGGNYGTSDFTDYERDMMPRLYADAGARATDDASVSLLQGRCVGGGTTVNWMLMLRPRPWVMDEWSGVHDAALLGADQLVPAMARVEREVGAAFLPDDAHSPANRIILDGAAALGWTAEPARINARGCVRAGTCGIGCSHGAKRSAGAVFLPRAVAAGARVISDTRADRIAHGTSANRVECTSLDRVTGDAVSAFSIEARTVVIAAGAIGTPVLLQKSGLGGGGVGRYLRLHPTTAVVGVYDRVMYGAAGAPQSSLLTQFMNEDDGYGFWIECPPMLPSLASVAVGGFGDDHRNAMRKFPNLAALIVLTRDGASRTRSSGSVLVHRSGRVHIRYRTDSRDRRLIGAGIAAAARLHLAAGAREASTLHDPALHIRSEQDIARIASASLAPNRISLFSAHVNGTCRMGSDPATAGCNPDAQLHAHPDIYIADGSVFPTAPGVNPQAAIMAIGSLVGERIAALPRP